MSQTGSNSAHRKRFFQPSRIRLIIISTLVITFLFAIPKIGLLYKIKEMKPDYEVNTIDMILGNLYTFITAFTFFYLNLVLKEIRLGHLKIDLTPIRNRLLVNILVWVLLNCILLLFHMSVTTPPVVFSFFLGVFTLTNFFIVVLAYLVSRIYDLIFRNQEISLLNESLKKKNAETKYEVLKGQVNPHFLFNSFNTLNNLIESDPDGAQQYVSDMSEVFRYVLSSSEKDLVRVEEELDFARSYMAILKGRFGDKLSVCYMVKDEDLNSYVPPLTIQILVENAIKHNIISTRHPLSVSIKSFGEDKLRISNTYQPRQNQEPSTGMGLQILNERFRFISQQEIMIHRTEEFTVTLPLLMK